MSFDFTQLKVPIYPNINDQPRTPTSQKAGNGSDIVKRFNELIDNLGSALVAVKNINSSGAKILEDDTTWYVGYQTSNYNVDGLTRENSFTSLSQALEVATSYQNPYSCARIIVLSPTSLDANQGHNGTDCPGFIPASSYDFITIQGEGANPTDTKLGNNEPVKVISSGLYVFDNLTFQTDSNYIDALYVDRAKVRLNNVAFGNSGKNHIYVSNHGVIEIINDYQIIGSASSHIFLDSFSFLDTSFDSSERTITIKNNPTFSNFVFLRRNSFLSCDDLIISGSAIGIKFYAESNSTINTNVGNMDLLPGNFPGELTGDSRYLIAS